jgi:hypothetical protein
MGFYWPKIGRQYLAFSLFRLEIGSCLCYLLIPLQIVYAKRLIRHNSCLWPAMIHVSLWRALCHVDRRDVPKIQLETKLVDLPSMLKLFVDTARRYGRRVVKTPLFSR